MEFNFSFDTAKEDVFRSVERFLKNEGLNIFSVDAKRPWGGFLVIDESQSELFIKKFFTDLDNELIVTENRISPKILIVAPYKRLSWQYHHRRSEMWKVLSDEVIVVLSDNDEEKNNTRYTTNDFVVINQGERHRLVGLGSWGIIAEIWQHTNKDFPTDEDDIVRVQDDYGR